MARRQRPMVSGALLKERTMRWCVSQEADALHGQAMRRTKKTGWDVVLDGSWHGGAVPGTSRAEGLRGAGRVANPLEKGRREEDL